MICKQIMFVLLVLITIKLTFAKLSLKANDLCQIEDTKCNDDNSSSSKCKPKCPGKYAYPCDHDYCATDPQTCDSFHYLTLLSKSYKGLRMHEAFRKKRSPLYEINLQKYNLFVKNIEVCQQRGENHESEEGICLNGVQCGIRQEIRTRHGNFTIRTAITCPCPTKYSYCCSKSYCTTNKQVCNYASGNLTLNKTTKKCSNDYLVIKKKLFLSKF